MGRELRRVPLDFDWPLDKVWAGYLNDKWKPCPEANKSCFDGATGGAHWFNTILRLLVLAGEESLGVSNVEEFDKVHDGYAERGRLYPHPYLTKLMTAPSFTHGKNARGEPVQRGESPVYYLTPLTKDLAELVEGLTGKKLDRSPLSSNSGIEWELNKRLRKLAKLPKGWGVCPVCKGEGVDPAVREAYEGWKSTEPPTGEGYQLWETTSEGSPQSPVFKTLDELCVWCESHATTFGSAKTTAAEWKKMLDDGLVVHREGNMLFL